MSEPRHSGRFWLMITGAIVGPTLVIATAAGVFGSILVDFAANGRSASAAHPVSVETRLAKVENRLRAIPPYDTCQIWVRSRVGDQTIPNAEVWVVELRATFITDTYGRVPIFRTDAAIVVKAPGFIPFEERIVGCGDDHFVYLKGRPLPVPKKPEMPR